MNNGRMEYNDILRGNIAQSQKEGQRLLQGNDDMLVWIDGSLIWGYVSLTKLKEWATSYPDENARQSLIRSCKNWRMSGHDSTYGYVKHPDDKSLWSVMFP